MIPAMTAHPASRPPTATRPGDPAPGEPQASPGPTTRGTLPGTGWLLAALLVAGWAAPAFAQRGATDTAGRHLLWTVRGPGRTLFLAGSIHALTADAYPLPDPFDRAFAAADTLVEEIDLGTMQTGANAAVVARGMLPQGRTLQQSVSPDTWSTLIRHTSGLGLPAEVLQPFEPWLAVLMIAALEAQRAGLEPALGLDAHFYDRAIKARKTVVGLETADSQVARLDALPAQVQEQMLAATLAEIDTSRAQLDTLVAAWRRGDTATIEAIALKDMRQHPEVYRSLIVERNRSWMPQIERCLTTGTCFVVVGAAHLVGPDGLLAMLAARGYELVQH